MTALLILMIIAAVILGLLAFIRLSTPRKNPLDRLETWMMDTREIPTSEVKNEHQSWLGILGGLAERTGMAQSFTERTRMELIRADIPLTGYEFNIARSLFSAVAGILTLAISRNPWMTIMAMVIFWILPMMSVKNKRNARYKAFSTQLGDALSILSNSLRAGFSFMQAVNSVAREMPDPVGKEFARLTKEMSLGMSTDDAMNNLVKRVEIDDLELLVTAILIQKETGGNLAEILDNIGVTIRERIKLKNDVRTLTAQGKLSGAVIALIPVMLGLFLFVMSPEYIMLLFTHPLGRIMLGVAVVNEIIGAFMIKKIITIDI